VSKPKSDCVPPVCTGSFFGLGHPPPLRPWIAPDNQLHVRAPPINHIELSRGPAEFCGLRLLLWQKQQHAKILLKISQMNSLNSTILRGQEFEERSEQAAGGLDILQRDLSESGIVVPEEFWQVVDREAETAELQLA
jgi:hypothetical protein